MKTPPAPPYLLPPDDAVSDLPWTTTDGRSLPDRLEHWDPFTDIEIHRIVEVDVDKIRAACQLTPDATVAIAASWVSSRTRLSGRAESIELGQLAGLLRTTVTLAIPGSQAGGRLDVTTSVVLRYPGITVTPISPRREGSILWTDETRVDLEGGASRFPITALDFTEVPRLPDGGSWGLEWSPEDLDAPVLGGLRLLINSNDIPLVDALRSGSSDQRSGVIRSFVMFDVARTLVFGALDSNRFTEDPESFDEGSVGRMLFELLVAGWPGLPITTLLDRKREDPARFEAELQAHIGVFR